MLYARPVNRDWNKDKAWLRAHTGINEVELATVLIGWDSDSTKLHMWVYPGFWTETLTPKPPWCDDPGSAIPDWAA